MEKISEAVITKVRAEAQNIIEEAEERARKEIERAKKQRKIKLEEQKRKMLEEAEEEAARISAQAAIKARQELLSAKTDIINEIINRVRNELSGSSSNKKHLLNLIKEATDGLGTDKVRIYVAAKDIGIVKNFLEGERKLSGKIMEIKEGGFLGGVIAESIDGKLRIDNTYETRLEMLLPKLLPEINKKLFQAA
ncbi:MAG TPA: V-type ATP synthase subunit E [Dehalococcoidia bacterium]|nr:V-type ATP synthase subunit E [Dehalococcoidia bacterium]